MKLQIFSDLHLDVFAPKPITVAGDIDAVIVAGDTCEGAVEAFEALRNIVPLAIPIVMVMGNHEFYGRVLPDELALAQAAAPAFNITLLDDDTAVIGGVRFVGATLWTDYRLFGETNAALAMDAARHGLNDHRSIMAQARPARHFHPGQALSLHEQSRIYLRAVLANPFPGPSVVVTHHAPHPGSVHPRFSSDLLSAAFVSDLSELIEARGPALWVHGHVHSSFDYLVGDTRILCNPHGYGPHENRAFNPALVVEVRS